MHKKHLFLKIFSLMALLLLVGSADLSASQKTSSTDDSYSICQNVTDANMSLEGRKAGRRGEKQDCSDNACSDPNLQKYCMCNGQASNQYKCGCKSSTPSSSGVGNASTQSSRGN